MAMASGSGDWASQPREVSDLPLELADLVVLACDLRDQGKELIKQADRLYDEVIVVALRMRYDPIDVSSLLPGDSKRIVEASLEERL